MSVIDLDFSDTLHIHIQTNSEDRAWAYHDTNPFLVSAKRIGSFIDRFFFYLIRQFHLFLDIFLIPGFPDDR